MNCNICSELHFAKGLCKKHYAKKQYKLNREKRLAQNKASYQRHRLKRIESSKNYALKNREIVLQKKKEYTKNNYKLNPKKWTERTMRWYHKNKHSFITKKNAKRKARFLVDPTFKLKIYLGNQIRHALYKKDLETFSLVKFTPKELKEHLEKMFTPEMSWENYGSYWHIDHKIPLAWFKTDKQVLEWGFRLSNLQPLPKHINLKKSDDYVIDVSKNQFTNEIFYLSDVKQEVF